MKPQKFTYLIFRPDGHIARIDLHRPPVNALNTELVDELTECARALRRMDDIWLVVVSSRLEVFCAGADLKERASMSLVKVPEFVRRIQGMVRAWLAVPQPVIVAVNGAALGGGLEFALAGDIIAAADSARLGFPEVSLGIIPGAGGTALMLHRTVPSAARKWVLTGTRFTAQEALTDGVVDYVFPAQRFSEVVEQLVQSVASNGPLALRQAKRAITLSQAPSLRRGFEIEHKCYLGLVRTDDRREALDAFLEKRKPGWKGT